MAPSFASNGPKVVHLSPTYMGADSIVGGGERYTTELAKAMAELAPTRLVSFGRRRRKERWGRLDVHIYKPLWYAGRSRVNPLSFGFLSSLLDADVVHCHHFKLLVTDLAILLGAALRKRVFVTDLSGGASISLWYLLPLWKGVRCMLLISDFNRTLNRSLPVNAEVISGGVDSCRFSPGQGERLPRILHVGRILPEKGIDDLVDSLPEGVGLDIVGPANDPLYYGKLKERARGKDVVFHVGLADDELIEMYRRSYVTVLPPRVDSGFITVMESMACGTPVIATRVASLPEMVEDGATGFLVPPGHPGAIREKIEYLRANPEICAAMRKRARKEAENRFSWHAVASRCLEIYQRS